ncbi:DUF881 domain-containing protein [Niallia sp. 01092]|uniref:DUF881 domain-containing protein n=1 Tax=unclassified Niallia TaxID=2837522 RepID=UPI003FD036F7
MKKKVKGSHVIFSFVFLILGFIVSFAYQMAEEEKGNPPKMDSQFGKDLALRNELIKQEKTNNQLQQQLKNAQNKLLNFEKELSSEAENFSALAEEAEKFRMYLGKVPVQGEGVSITLEDGDYNPKDENINHYLVHEHHIFQVVNELYISGATAISINGQRLSHHSYILCNGPVIEIDGYQHPAPFIITAIGNSDVLEGAINIPGGVKDQLVNENVKFTVEKTKEVKMKPFIGS